MSGSMYDLSVTTFSPEGKIFQIEYAQKAVEVAETVVGIRCKDGVLLGADKLVFSKLLVPGTNRRIHHLDTAVGAVFAGRVPDGRALVTYCRKEAAKYENSFKIPIPGRILSERLGMFVNAHTLYGSVRPFGAALIVASHSESEGYGLHMVEPAGSAMGYFACTAGKGRQIIKAELEKRDFRGLTCREALAWLVKMLILSHEETREKKYEIEVSWLCEESGRLHRLVPEDLRRAAEAAAEQSIEQDQMGQ